MNNIKYTNFLLRQFLLGRKTVARHTFQLDKQKQHLRNILQEIPLLDEFIDNFELTFSKNIATLTIYFMSSTWSEQLTNDYKYISSQNNFSEELSILKNKRTIKKWGNRFLVQLMAEGYPTTTKFTISSSNAYRYINDFKEYINFYTEYFCLDVQKKDNTYTFRLKR